MLQASPNWSQSTAVMGIFPTIDHVGKISEKPLMSCIILLRLHCGASMKTKIFQHLPCCYGMQNRALHTPFPPNGVEP